MRKIPAALLSLALTASLAAPPAAAAARNSSLPELDGHWSQAAFERWHSYGIVEGDSRGMRPDDAMMVSEFAALLSRTMGYTDQADNHYADLKGDEWYAPYILQLTAAGILEGDGTNCKAEELMSRERATVLFARALGIRPSENPDLSGFADGDTAADWSAGYIDAMAKAGIIQGVGNHLLALGADITRGSVVTILDNSVAEYANEAGASVTGDVDGMLLVAADNVTVKDAQISGNVLVAPKAGQTGQKNGGSSLHMENSTLKSDLLVNTHGAALTLDSTQVEGEAVLSGDRASLTLGDGTRLSVLAVDGADGNVSVGQNAAVDTLAARQAVKVDNQGTITAAQVDAKVVEIVNAKTPIPCTQCRYCEPKCPKKIAIPAFISGIFGVTEPAIYGVTLPKKKPFIYSCIGGAIGGAFIGMMGVRSYSMGGLGLFGLPSYIDVTGTTGIQSLINVVIGTIIASVIGFVLTWFLYKDDAPAK